MKRYRFLDRDSVFEALNQLRHAFLAAKDGEEVDIIIKAVLTFDERMKIGRRVLIAYYLSQDWTYEQIAHTLKVGKSTILEVVKQIDKYADGFKLIEKRETKVDKEYADHAYRSVGGPTLVFKPKVYTGYTRKQVKR